MSPHDPIVVDDPLKTPPEGQWTTEHVAAHLEDAAMTIRALPAVRQRSVKSAWPEYVYNAQEREVAQNEASARRRMRVLPSAKQLSRLDITLDWFRYVDKDEFELLWMRANKQPWKYIMKVQGCSRATANRNWQFAVAKVTSNLNGWGMPRSSNKEGFIGRVAALSARI